MYYPWFKFYADDYLTEVKLKGVDANHKSCFVVVLCFSAKNDGAVDTLYLTSDLVKIDAGVPMGGQEWNKMGDFYEWLVDRGFGTLEGTVFRFKNWDERQNIRSNAERQAAYRKRNAVVTVGVTNVTTDKNRTDKNREDNTLFDQVWEIYPKKVGKAEARKAFDKLKVDSALAESIISSIALHKSTSQWLDNDARYVPHLSTFLNQKRYEDEVKEMHIEKAIKL